MEEIKTGRRSVNVWIKNIKRQRTKINNLRTEIKAIFGLLHKDGCCAINEGVVHDEQETFIGDRLFVEGTIEKQADDNKGCERLVEAKVVIRESRKK